MKAKFLAALKNPTTYVVLAVGVVVALAFGRFLKPVKKLADKIPGSDAKTAA